MIRDIMRIFGSFEDEIIIISSRIEDNISFMKERIPEGMSLNLGSFYIMIIYIDNMAGKNIPVNIYNSEIGYNPYIIIPVKYLVNEEEIEQYRVRFKIEKWDETLKSKRIIIIEKCRKCESYKKCHNDTIHNQEWMPVTHENKLFPFPEILTEKNLIKIIHRKQGLLNIWNSSLIDILFPFGISEDLFESQYAIADG